MTIAISNPSIGEAFRALSAVNPRQRLSFSRGFTLIEIMVVIAILGIATVVATANLFPSDEEKFQQESEKLLAVLQLARDEAAFGGRIIAVNIGTDEIRFLERDFADTSRWNASTLEQLQPRKLSKDFNAQLRVGNSPGGTDPRDNFITFLPIGVAAPFELTLNGAIGTRKINGDAIGNLRLVKEPV